MNNNKNNKEEKQLLNLSIFSTTVFILASLVSLMLSYDEKGDLFGGKTYFTKKQTLNISFYNRIVIIVAFSISLYVGYKNYNNETEDIPKFKSGLLLTTNILSLTSAFIILYVAYLNKQEQSITVADVQNPLI
jgi:hypothetical protein